MDEKYLQYKKSKQYKFHLLMNFLLFILFCIIIYCAYLFYKSYNSEEKTQIDEHYTYTINDNIVILLNEGIKQSEYKCKSNCDIYGDYFINGRILLNDGLVYYLYDMVNLKRISGEYDKIDFILNKNEEIKLFKVTSGNKEGIIDLFGNIQVSLIYDKLGNYNEEGILVNYVYDKNYITAKSGAKWGVISLTNEKGLIDFQYDDIIVSQYNKIAVKEADLWYLVDEVNKRIISKGYSSMAVYENYLVVSENNEAFIINMNGEIQSNRLPLMTTVNYWLFQNNENGLYSKLENNQICIYVKEITGFNRYVFNEEMHHLGT